MKNFRNFSIKKRFLILFFICIITFVSFGVFALIQMDNLAEVTQKLYTQSSKVSEAAVKAKLDLIKINSSIKDVILLSNTNEIESQINKVSEYETDMQKNLDIMDQNSVDSNTKRNLQDSNDLLSKWWKPQRDKIIEDVKNGKKNEAIDISKGISSDFVDQLELDLDNIYSTSSDNQISLIQQSNEMQNSERTTLIITLTVLISILTLTFILMALSILNPINKLKEHMAKISKSGDLEEYKIIDHKNEITEMAKNYNELINKLKHEFWINDNRNSLNEQMVGNISVKELTQKTINFLSRSLDSGTGTFYIYNSEKNVLTLNSSFAFTEREVLSNTYEIGQGIIGQVALEKKPILLTNVRKSDAVICSGTINGTPLNVYAFPLIYNDQLYGVIELSSFEAINELKQKFIERISSVIAVNLYSAVQNEKIKQLLKVSEKATKEAQEVSAQLISANSVLEEQQRQLQAQTEELQQTNSQLEEQQQILQQQSEELQQTNAQLEENQSYMEEQSKLLNAKNDELEKSRIEILERSKELEMANKYKTQFLANVSHELRTPLNSIILLSKLLIKGCKDVTLHDSQEKIKVIFNAGQDLLNLINDILDLSKIEAGKIELNYTYFNSSEITEELNSLFNENAVEKNIQFICEDKFKDTIYGDKEKISQVLKNFLSNSFKFTENGSVKLKIEENTKGDNSIVFSVIDTGIGISKEHLDTIFDEFHQADGSISRKYGGTGLGLSISTKLCDLMKGKINVISEVDMGSTFSLHLPIIVQEHSISSLEEVAATSTIMNNEVQHIINVQENEIKKEKNKQLLIIEDDKTLIDSIKAISEGIGFQTVTSNNGNEGFKLLKENDVDGIVLDLGLPDVGGIELLKKINLELKQRKLSIPVVIYTGMQINTEQEKEIKLYADSIIIKTTNSFERLLDELTLILHKFNGEKEYKNIITSKINKDRALNLENKKILIVDDDSRNIFVLAAALEEYGAEIIEAENGKIALDELQNETCDLILMDIMMPVMNGYDTIKAIRNNDSMKDIPIIATTAKSLKGDREKCMEAGANDYISKPIDYDVLITLVKAWINKA
ncbi:response regulator [Clostridium saccharobutylicum]|uniref:response regulator n=1 Tax=Clostridium saccharobutylicum TaxID=169679 RepID=UPI00156EF766|nr:response regulator [Clostridium saccharobutylicum]NSB89078.1 signal transduction histidine kinase/DNA-binding response OmpR family regulator [Clostridium saccharobutylicum]NYC30927.1 signal transduction histidine kinase/DNA-binding response OmpR family regulator [Clostridium saccharobutylicum]